MKGQTLTRRIRPLKHAVRSYETAIMERWLNIDTESQTEAWGQRPRSPGSYVYEATTYYVLHRYLAYLRPGPADCVYDVGCGAGRVLALLARMRLRKVVGIELFPDLAEQARANLRRLRGCRSPWEVRTGDALEADYSEGTIYFMYNPFGPAVIAGVLARIRENVRQQPRRVRFLYIHPCHEKAFYECGWLRRTGHKSLLGFEAEASYWTNV